MLDLPIMGVNAPKEHQRVIAQLTAELYFMFKKGIIPYEPLPEVMVDESQTSATPDVSLYDNKEGLNKVIIEVSGKAGFRKDFSKISEVCGDYNIPEGFVYNYITGEWRKFKNGTGEITGNPSFCDSIGYDLNDFLSK